MTCLAACLLAGVAAAQPSEGDGWLRLDSSGPLVISNASPERTREISENLNTLTAVLARWMGSLGVDPPVETKVFVFRDDEAFWPYKEGINGDPSSVAGFFLAHPLGNYLAINGDERIDPARVVYHEVLHYFARYHLPGIPLWFNEGLAEFYSGFRVEEDEAVLGVPHASHLEWLRNHPLLPLDDLFAVDVGSDTYNERSRRGPYYAQSWALVHYLMAGGGRRSDQLVDFLARLSGGEDVESAFERAFDARFGTLEKELAAYVAQPELPVIVIPREELPATAGQGRLRPISRGEAAYYLGDLLVHSAPALTQRAVDHFNLALAENPEHAPSYGGLGMVEDLRGSYDDASGFYLRALELDPSAGLTNYLLGRNVLLAISARGVDTARRDADFVQRLEGAIDAFHRSLAVDPRFPEAWVALGTAWSYHPRPEDEGLTALERAHGLLPERVDVLYNLAVLYARLGDGDAARRTIERELLPRAGEELADKAREAVRGAEILEARRLLRDGDTERALAALETILERDEDPRVVEVAEEMLELALEKTALATGGLAVTLP
jgi:tetratricopeptide (TPR) repeat protein